MGTNLNKKMFRNSHDIILEENGRGRYYSHDHTSYRRDHSRVDKVRGNSDNLRNLIKTWITYVGLLL